MKKAGNRDLKFFIYDFILVGVILNFCFLTPCFAKDKIKDKPAAKPAQAQIQQKKAQEKNMLLSDIDTMRAQELRIIVLRQLLSEESTRLDSVQEMFCSKYKLDLDKLRQGLYRYDDKQAKFVENSIPVASEKK